VADEGSLHQVTAAEAIELAGEGTMLIDVREQWEWDRGHAPQAVLTPMSAFGDFVDELPTDADILVVCHSGARSFTVATALAEGGYRVIDVLGGMTAWEQAGGPLVSAVPPSASA
jgi:rhodanese-related sulfurtransferase